MQNLNTPHFDTAAGQTSPAFESEPNLRVLNLKCASLSEVLPRNDLWFSFFDFGVHSLDDLAQLGGHSAKGFSQVLKDGLQSREPVYLANFGSQSLTGDERPFSCFLVPKPRVDLAEEVGEVLQYCVQMISGVAKSSLGIMLSPDDLSSEKNWVVFESLIYSLGRNTNLATISFSTVPDQYLELVNRLATLRLNLHAKQKEFICEIFH